MSSGTQNTDIKLIGIIFPGLGLVVTACRLALRFRLGRFWWDDAFAVVSAICTALISAVKWIYYTSTYEQRTRIAAYYTMGVVFYIALWTARLSILYSLVRILMLPATRTLLHCAATAFACVCAILSAQIFWVCETQSDWKDEPTPKCPLGLQVVLCQLLTDLAADTFLIVVPVRLLHRIALARPLKARLIIVFGAAALTSLVSLIHATFLLRGHSDQSIVAAIVEVSVSLIVCNLVVVVPALWRLCAADTDHERVFKHSTARTGAGTATHGPLVFNAPGSVSEEVTTADGMNSCAMR